jgi:hypothetical protein
MTALRISNSTPVDLELEVKTYGSYHIAPPALV